MIDGGRPSRVLGIAVGLAWIGGCGDMAAPNRPGPPGDEPALLTRRDPEPAGANCPHGGTAVRAGLDRNGNGALDDTEVDRIEYICNAAAAVLVRQDVLPPGPSCPSGGTAVQVGVDDNGNGRLEDAEIDRTTTLCGSSELWSGDFTTASWSDPVQVAALQGARVVVGSLAIAGAAAVALPHLEVVTGNLAIAAGGGVSLPALATVGGDLTVLGGTTALSAGHLASVFGGIDVEPEHGFALALPALEAIGRDLRSASATLSGIELPHLQRLGGNLELGQDVACGTRNFGRTDLGDTGQMTALTTVSLPKVDAVGGCVVVVEAPALATLDLGSAHHVGGPFEVFQAPALTAMSLRSLESIDSTGELPFPFQVTNTGLVVLDLPMLTRVNGALVMFSNERLEAVQLPLLESTTFVDIHVTGLWVEGNPVLTRLSAPKVSVLGTLELDGPSAPSALPWQLEFTNLASVDTFAIRGGSLAELSGMPHLSEVGFLTLAAVDQLTDLRGLPALRSVAALELFDNPALRALDGLEQVHQLGTLLAGGNPALTSVAGLRNVTEIGGTLWLLSNNALTDVGLTGLRSIGQNLTIRSRALTSLSGLDALQSVGSLTLDAASNPALPPDEIAAFRARLGM